MRRSRLTASHMSPNERRSIAAQYLSGESVPTIAKLIGVSQSFILKCVKESGIPTRPKTDHGHLLCPPGKKQLIADYAAGATCRSLAVKYGFKSHASVWGLLKSRGLTRPSSAANRRYTLNEAAFDSPLTPEKQYWIGMMMTDGYVSPKQDGATTIGLQLKASDKEHVDAFRAFLGTDQPVYVVTNSGYEKSYRSDMAARLQVRSWQLAKSLAAVGVIPNKSKIAIAIGIEHDPDFWRGCVDGDGSIMVHTGTGHKIPYVGLCGASIGLMTQFSDFCRARLPSCRATVVRGHHTWSVRIGGGYAIQLLRILGYNKDVTALSRKKIRAQEILSYSIADPEWCNRRGVITSDFR